MSVAAWFFVGTMVTYAIAHLSKRHALRSVAGLLGLSWLACNLVTKAGVWWPQLSVFHIPVQMGVYALIDVVWLYLILWACRNSREGSYLRWPMAIFYLTSLCAHSVAVILYLINSGLAASTAATYYNSLDVIFALELFSVGIYGGGILAWDIYSRYRTAMSLSWGVGSHSSVDQ